MDGDEFRIAVERAKSYPVDIVNTADADRDNRIEELEKRLYH